MAIHEHLTEFAGLPVVDYTPGCFDDRDARIRAAFADPGTAAWRLRAWYAEQKTFAAYFSDFTDQVDAAHVTALIMGEWLGRGGLEDSGADGVRDLLISQADRFPALRSLFLGEFTAEEFEISWIQQCDVTPLLAAFPRLEEFVVRGGSGLEFPATRHGSLRRLTVQTGGLPRGPVAGITASDLPALEHLELWLGVEGYGRSTEVDDLDRLLSGGAFPRLRSLGLRNAEHTDDLVRALAEAPLLDRLEVLDLSLGTLSDAGAEVIAQTPAFRRLRRLDLHHHYLSEEGQERLRAALPGVDLDLDDRREPDEFDPADDDPEYFRHGYPAVTE